MLNLLPDIELQESQEIQYVYKLGATKPAAPTGGTGDEDHVPTGWSVEAPDPTNTENVYRAQRTVSLFAGSWLSITAWGTVTKVADALPVDSLDYIYALGASLPSAPTGGNNVENHTPTGWARIEPSPTPTENVYRAQRTRTYVAGVFKSAGNWGGVVKVADHTVVTTTDTDYVYSLSLNAPSVPTGGENTLAHQPDHWRRTPMSATSARAVFSVSRTRTYANNVFQSATAWGDLQVHENIAHTTVSFTQYIKTDLPLPVSLPDNYSWASYPGQPASFTYCTMSGLTRSCTTHTLSSGLISLWDVDWGSPLYAWTLMTERTVTWVDGKGASPGAGAGRWDSSTDIRTGNHTSTQYAVRRSTTGTVNSTSKAQNYVPAGWSMQGEDGGTGFNWGFRSADVTPTATQNVYMCRRTTTWNRGTFVSATHWGNSRLIALKTGVDTPA